MLDSVLAAFGYLLFALGLLAGVALIPFGLPGTFIIVGVALLQAFLTDFMPLSGTTILWLLGLAALGEVIEFFLGAFAARHFGGSKYAMAGAIVGGFVGAIWATGIFPIVGTLLGAFGGAFAGAALFEYVHEKDWNTAIHVGWGAFLGALGGKLTKITIGICMVVIILFKFF